MESKSCVHSIYRHLVKGLRQESLEETTIKDGGSIPGDRAFAFQYLDTPSDTPEETAPWISKKNLVNQHDWPSLAEIRPSWNEESNCLSLVNEMTKKAIHEDISEIEARDRLANFVWDNLSRTKPFSKAYHPELTPLRLIGNSSPQNRYTDGSKGPISLALVESLKDLESKFRHSVDERRFRLNLFLAGAPAWSELSWAGRRLQIGSVVLEIYKPLARCPNIDVDQNTGERVDPIFSTYKEKLGHTLFGVKATVIQGGVIKINDAWNLL
ncbi:MOSC domain-containing protein [bacterium]|nr:MOSC domain-containing protein [bacterium]